MKYDYNHISEQQTGEWNYTEAERRNAVIPDKPRRAPRYVLKDGVWQNPEAQNTGHAKLLITGDLMCQERLITEKKKEGTKEDYNFDSCLSLVKNLFTVADLSVGNLEGVVHPEAPYSNEQLYIGKWYNRNFPPQFLEMLRYTGFDLLTTANNHMLDTGLKGLARTCEYLDRYGFMHTGSFTDTDQPHYVLVDVNGICVGVLSYTVFYNFSPAIYVTERARKEILNVYTAQKAARDAAEACKAGAEYLICCIHWGKEMVHNATDKQCQMAQELADAGVDYIVGSHAHVIQPYDVITAVDGRKVPVIYSAGNLISHFKERAPKTSLIIELDLERTSDGKITVRDSYVPCYTFQRYDGKKYVTAPLNNKVYTSQTTNDLVYEQKRLAAKVLGKKIPLSHTFDLKGSQPVQNVKKNSFVRDYLLPDLTPLQKNILDSYRVSDFFRKDYGGYMVENYPNGESVRTAIRQIKKFTGEDATVETHRDLIADMIYTKYVLGFAYWEYFVYGLEDKTPQERTEFMPQNMNMSYYKKINDSYPGCRLLNNKYMAYEKFKPYYKREVIKLGSMDQHEEFNSFCHRHARFIAKPLSASVGTGVQLVDSREYPSADVLFAKLVKEYVEDNKTEFLCEELIICTPSLSGIHPESVNSLRIFTYYNDVEVKLLCAWLKAGRGTAVIDNGTAGGMLAAIDCETGIVTTPARDELNNTFEKHPDTGFVFPGFQIEAWEEAVAMVKEMALLLPSVRCIGWDIVLSADRGWQVIEGNAHGMFNVLQVATKKGMRREFLNIIEWDKISNRED